jgi:hypothetical protein
VPLPQLRRIRWAVRATLLLGVAASVLANILHALDNPISQAIAAWPPVALLLTVELISRVPVHRRLLAATRLIATATIAGIAAWVSYWHMAGVAARYGETGASPYLLPLSVDGLIVVASICLVELGGRIATLEQPAAHIMVDALPSESSPADAPDPSLVRAAADASDPNLIRAAADASDPGLIRAAAARTAPAEAPVELPAPLRRSTAAALAEVAATLPRSPSFTRGAETLPHRSTGGARSGGLGSHPTPAQRRATPPAKNSTRARRSPAETVALAARIKADRPTITEAELAAELGISPSRWRTVRREADLAA